MTKTLFLVAVTLAAFPAHSYATANTFATTDAEAMNKFNMEVVALEDDINQVATTLNQPDAFALRQVQCLLELSNALDAIDARLSEITGLIGVSAAMKHSDDERRVNKEIALSTRFSLGSATRGKTIALRQAANCSTSAVVNTYAQKTEVIANRAASGISWVDDKLSGGTQK